MITRPVERLRDSLGLPGMLVVQFAFDPTSPTRRPLDTTSSTASSTPARTTTTPRAAGTSRSTARGARWSTRRSPARDPRAPPVVGADPARLLLARALAMVQAQDVLGLGSEGRMNRPGSGGAWRWRLERGALTPALGRRLREATEAAGRLTS